jgi:hypothetical protein
MSNMRRGVRTEEIQEQEQSKSGLLLRGCLAKELARTAFAEFAATNSIASVRDLLALDTGERWDIKRVRGMLASRTYIGEWRWGPRFVNPTAIKDPIIDPQVFAQVQLLLANRGRGDKKANPRKNATVNLPEDGDEVFDYLFLGRVRCACGGAMTPYWSRGRHNRRYYYYECYQSRAATCHIGRVSASTLQESVLSELVRMGKSPWRVRQLLAEAREKLPDAENLVREVVGLRRQDKQMASQEDRIVESIATTNKKSSMLVATLPLRSIYTACWSVSIKFMRPHRRKRNVG